MDNLIIAFLNFLINVNIFDVKRSIVLEEFLTRVPIFKVLYSTVILFYRDVLNLDLFMQIIHSIIEKQVIRAKK
jgi:hypothetical protein